MENSSRSIYSTMFIHHMKKIIIEKTIRYVKDRTESYDDYFLCRKECEEGRGCKL
jgi:hypothetical protein